MLISSCVNTPASKQEECGFKEMMEGISCIEPNLEEIAKHSLGSRGNPIRADGPKGQREYLSKLICLNGDPIWDFKRGGSVGMGPYGFMLDVYIVLCNTEKGVVEHSVYMDLYHKNYKESGVAYGFKELAK